MKAWSCPFQAYRGILVRERLAFSMRGQIANTSVFESHEARPRILCRHLYNKKENIFPHNYCWQSSKYNNNT